MHHYDALLASAIPDSSLLLVKNRSASVFSTDENRIRCVRAFTGSRTVTLTGRIVPRVSLLTRTMTSLPIKVLRFTLMESLNLFWLGFTGNKFLCFYVFLSCPVSTIFVIIIFKLPWLFVYCHDYLL